MPHPIDPAPAVDDPLPHADVVVITWTVDEVAGLAHVMTPKVSAQKWHRYARDFETYRPKIRPHAPAATSGRLGSYMPTMVGDTSVLCMKSELHLNQDGVKTGEGTATLPVKDFFQQIIKEVKPKVFLTIGTSGSVYDAFGLGDVVVTRAAKFRLQNEFRNEAFNGKAYQSKWTIPDTRLDDATKLMHQIAAEVIEPPFGPPTNRYDFTGGLLQTPANDPQIRRDGVDMPEFHPILTTDYFEYGTTTNRLDKEGAAVEMGDAALGLAVSELAAAAATGPWCATCPTPPSTATCPPSSSRSTSRPRGLSATTPPTASGPARSARWPPGASSPASTTRPLTDPSRRYQRTKDDPSVALQPCRVTARRLVAGEGWSG